MPATAHLKWLDMTDFSAGLWTRDSGFLMPAEAFATMENCYPQPGGGLRAFFKPVETTITTIGAGERPIWFDSWTTTGTTTFLLLSVVAATGQLKAYIRDDSDAAWTLSKTFTTPTGGATASTQATATQYIGSDAKRYFAVSLADANATTDSGIWLYDIAAGTWGAIASTSGKDVVITTYQSRLVVRDDSVNIGNNVIAWTDPGGITFPADNTLTLNVNYADASNGIAAFVPFSPSSLLVATLAGGWYMIEGDLEDPIVREMGDTHGPNIGHGTRISRTDDGVVFVDPASGLYIAQNMGSSFERLDPQLLPYKPPDQIAGYGTAYYKDFLFAPNGRVMDYGSKAWFTLPDGAGATKIDFYHPLKYESSNYAGFNSAPGIYAPQFASAGKILYYDVDEASGARAESYTVKTAPLRDEAQRRVAVREVQVSVKSFHADSTVAVTVDGVTQTSAAIPVGNDRLRFHFRTRAEYQDVQVVCASNESGFEAPIIENLAFGVRPNEHLLR